MTREVVSVGPDTSAKYAGALMAGNGYAALPVVDGDNRLLGVVAEADVLRDRMPEDPRLHLRRDTEQRDAVLPLLVRDVMTTAVISAEPATDLADLARLLVDRHVRSVPVVEDGVVVGIVSRRDVLRTLVRPDADIRSDILRLVEGYTGDLGCWDVHVTEGVASVRRTKGAPQVSRAVEEFALQRLVDTVPGVVAVHVLPTVAAPHADASA
jgi:CBS domain-containing protein